jgi:hypothetical protein
MVNDTRGIVVHEGRSDGVMLYTREGAPDFRKWRRAQREVSEVRAEFYFADAAAI